MLSRSLHSGADRNLLSQQNRLFREGIPSCSLPHMMILAEVMLCSPPRPDFSKLPVLEQP